MASGSRKLWGLGLHWAWVPLVNFAVGLATIVTLLVLWLAEGHPRYRGDESTVVYISDVGAAHKAVFIALASTTAVLFFVTISLDFLLRHMKRIPKRLRRRERAWAVVSTFFAFFTMLFCILLTIFDAFNHDTLHWPFAATFFICLVLSGIANLVEIAYLSRDYRGDPLLKTSFFLKLTIIVLGVCALISIAVIAGICNHRTPPGGETNQYCNRPSSGEAALEWFLAVCFLAYIGTIVFDMYPSRYTSRHVQHNAGAGLQQMIQGQTHGLPHDVELGSTNGAMNGHTRPGKHGSAIGTAAEQHAPQMSG